MGDQEKTPQEEFEKGFEEGFKGAIYDHARSLNQDQRNVILALAFAITGIEKEEAS